MTELRRWSLRTGDWFGILGAQAMVALPPSQKARVAAVWELVDAGAGFDQVLDAVIAGGLRDLPGFVLVSGEGDHTRVLVRGNARVQLSTDGEVVHVAGADASIWTERTVSGVTRTRIELGTEPQPVAEDLVVASGVVRLATAVWPPDPPRHDAPVSSASAWAGHVPELADGPPTEAMPAVSPAAQPSEHDGRTRSGELQPTVPAATIAPVARLVFASGADVPVDRTVLVGRSPEHHRHAEPGEPRVVVVPSPHHEISSTHLEVRPGSGADHGTAVVTDLGSTNGTVLVQPGLPPEDLRPGVAVQLIPGAVVDLGDGVTFRVVDP